MLWLDCRWMLSLRAALSPERSWPVRMPGALHNVKKHAALKTAIILRFGEGRWSIVMTTQGVKLRRLDDSPGEQTGCHRDERRDTSG